MCWASLLESLTPGWSTHLLARGQNWKYTFSTAAWETDACLLGFLGEDRVRESVRRVPCSISRTSIIFPIFHGQVFFLSVAIPGFPGLLVLLGPDSTQLCLPPLYHSAGCRFLHLASLGTTAPSTSFLLEIRWHFCYTDIPHLLFLLRCAFISFFSHIMGFQVGKDKLVFSLLNQKLIDDWVRALKAKQQTTINNNKRNPTFSTAYLLGRKLQTCSLQDRESSPADKL